MPIQLLLAYVLGAAASLAAVIILIPVGASRLRSGGRFKALAAAAFALPSLLLLLLAAPATIDVGPFATAPLQDEFAGLPAGTATTGQDMDWGLLSHKYLGGPPPGTAAAPADGSVASMRAQRSAAELVDITRREPGNVQAWLAMAQAHRQAREYPAAISAYESALKLDSGNADAWADYADALASSNQRKLAGKPATAIARSLKLDPSHAKGLWLQASLDLELHRYDAALVQWKKLRATLPPGSPDIGVIDANIAETEQLAAGK